MTELLFSNVKICCANVVIGIGRDVVPTKGVLFSVCLEQGCVSLYRDSNITVWKRVIINGLLCPGSYCLNQHYNGIITVFYLNTTLCVSVFQNYR